MKNLIRKIENFEIHHQIIVFLAILIGTIILTRALVFVYNPNPTIFNFELHHFDYGVLLLLISSKLLLFGPKNHKLIYLTTTAVASGLIIDDYWFIRKSVIESPDLQTQLYNATFPIVIILTLGVMLLIFFTKSVNRSNKR